LLIDTGDLPPGAMPHPREDLLFAKLKARDPEDAAGIIDIAAEHGQAARRLKRFARLVDEVLDDQQIRLLQLAHALAKCPRRSFRADFNRRQSRRPLAPARIGGAPDRYPRAI
jgi:hypothetical protein